MSFDYAKLATNAKRLLTRFGMDVVLRGPPERTTKGVRVQTIAKEIEGSGVQVGDIKILLAATCSTPTGEVIDTEPQRGELIATANDNLVIMNVEPIRPGDVTVAWYVYGRIG